MTLIFLEVITLAICLAFGATIEITGTTVRPNFQIDRGAFQDLDNREYTRNSKQLEKELNHAAELLLESWSRLLILMKPFSCL